WRGTAAPSHERNRSGRAARDGLRQPKVLAAGAAPEQPGGPDALAGDDPRLVGLVRGGGRQAVRDQDRVLGRRHAHGRAAALHLRLRAVGEDVYERLLFLVQVLLVVERARQVRGPDAENDRRGGARDRQRGGRNRPAAREGQGVRYFR